jgi:asparagine synthase (glutamine-hydrolysing)
MCGIAGFFNLNYNRDDAFHTLDRMCDAIVHRGPDDKGYYVDRWVGLGMRRLSIIDLQGGHQPISNEDATKTIVFNGEIYNYQPLRENLISSGHQFNTSSDTEVILHQYEQTGEDCVNALNGMFAFAIWDQCDKSLFIARDRMGVKPLYYYWDGSKFLFASEIKAIICSEEVKHDINPTAIWDYLTFRYIPQPESVWKNIYKLLPGHSLRISIDHPCPDITKYWDIPYTDEYEPKSEAEYYQEFEQLFLDSVRLRLISDVPVGILLSGGLDSSSVAAAIAKIHNSRLSSFSVAFENSPDINELPYARKVAEYIGTDHNEIVIGEKEFCEYLTKLVYFTDEPLSDLASVPLYYVSKLASEKVKVVLSGEGSDEILAGYQFDRNVRLWDRIRGFQRIPKLFREGLAEKIVGSLSTGLLERLQKANTSLSEYLVRYPLNMTCLMNTATKQALWQDNVAFVDSFARIINETKSARSKEPLHQALYVYCQSWLVEDLLMKADKMTMANSIELRVPFLDYRIVSWAAQSPPWVKVNKNSNNQYETKWVLRKFARKYLPPDIVSRKKMGFPVPVYDWLSGSLKNMAFDTLSKQSITASEWFKYEEIEKLLIAGTSVNANIIDRHRLWNLIVLELWFQAWKGY